MSRVLFPSSHLTESFQESGWTRPKDQDRWRDKAERGQVDGQAHGNRGGNRVATSSPKRNNKKSSRINRFHVLLKSTPNNSNDNDDNKLLI